MKRLLSLVAITVFLVALAIGYNSGTLLACGPGCFIEAEHSQATATKKLENVHLDVKGMTCDACASKIKSELAKLPEVKENNIDWKKGTVDIKVTQGSNHKALGETVKRLGFEVSSLKCECGA
ncbi:MAG TPA: heavy metal-associated domain-containing protein [Candidatus Brocadiales bacterium]|nr:heavy metal-associated domain-containing protein [Candidatus Brocadiales bacterium]